MYRNSPKVSSRWIMAVLVVSAFCVIVKTVPSAFAFPRYNDGCYQCHGAFTDGTSPKGTVFPGNSKHTMHRNNSYMGTNCDLCHTDGDGRDPFMNSSNGTNDTPGLGCVGCHGRYYKGIGDSGVGLRAHHAANGVALCSNCHFLDPAPLPENILPSYYGSVDTNADDPCNSQPDYLENWSIGDLEGLDNDGDNLYDGDDPDCDTATPCPGDITGPGGDGVPDGTVDTNDLLFVFANWGPGGGNGPADVSGPGGDGLPDGTVDTNDLLFIFANWGLCK